MKRSILISLLIFSAALIAKADDPGDVANGGVCRTFFSNNGYLFDNYEKHDYQGGFLNLHFKLKDQYNDGRGWSDKVFLHKSNCSATSYTTEKGWADPVPAKIQFFSIRFNSEKHYDIWNDEQDVKIECAGCSGDLPDGDYRTISYSGQRDGGATFFHSGSYPIKEEVVSELTPLLIIPGLMGSELKLNDQLIWPNLISMTTNPGNDFLDPLAFNPQGEPVNGLVVKGDILSGINYYFGDYHYSDLLQNDLEKAGYKKNQNYFVMSYDWRFGLNRIEPLLKQKIENILAQTGANKIDIVAHSLGGLVAKEYIREEGESKIGKMIFVGVPHLGSAVAARSLLFGDNFNIPLLNSSEVHKIVQNMPSLYDLLPGPEYFKKYAGFYDDLTNSDSKNILNYEQSKNFLLGLNKNARLLNSSQASHLQLDNLGFTSMNIFNIVGCGTPTLKTISKMYYGENNLVKKIFNQPKYRINMDNGDGTVLINSAGLNISPNQQFYVPGVQHNQLLSADGGRKTIMSILLKETSPAGVYKDPLKCPSQGKLVSLPSNLELTIVNPKTGEKLIAGKDYSQQEIGSDKFISFSGDDDFKIFAVNAQKSSETINFSIKNYINEKTEYYNDIPIKKELSVESQNGKDLVQNLNEEGSATSLAPIISMSDSENDTQPPITSLVYSGNSYGSGQVVLNSGRDISLKAVTSFSGVKFIKFSFDKGETWNVLEGNTITVPEDATDIFFFSVSNNDLAENPKIVNFKNPELPAIAPDSNNDSQEPDIQATDSSEEPVISDVADLSPQVFPSLPINLTIQLSPSPNQNISVQVPPVLPQDANNSSYHYFTTIKVFLSFLSHLIFF